MAFLELDSDKLNLKFRYRKEIPHQSVLHTQTVRHVIEKRIDDDVIEKRNHKYQEYRFKIIHNLTLQLISLLFDDSNNWTDELIRINNLLYLLL